MEERTFHNKVYWITFLFSVLVIWVHSYNGVLYLGNEGAAYSVVRLERFIGNALGQLAVPGFFMVSSYLFFRNFRLEILKQKWTSRIKSVLVPYIVWNSLYYFGYVIGSRLPVISDIIGKGTIPFNLPSAVDSVLHYTYNYVFWYLYQLILLIILAPLIYLLVKRVWLGILFLAVILTAVYLGRTLPLLNLDALFYYSCAAFAAVHGRKIVEKPFDWKRCMLGAGMIILGCVMERVDLPGRGIGELAAATVVFRFLVPAGVWFMLPEQRLMEAADWMKQNFFLYAVHFALVRLINKTGALLLPPVPAIPIVAFLLMPAIAVFLSWQIGRFLRRYLPHIWILLNGGR